MAEFRPATPDQEELRRKLHRRRPADRQRACPASTGAGSASRRPARRRRSSSRAAEPDGAEPLRFPPVLPRHQFERSGYLKSFPHLAGSVFAFEGDEEAAREQYERAAAHEDWSEFQSMTDLVLMPAACYPVYPAIAARGPLPGRRRRPSTPAAPTSSATSPRATRRGCRCSTSARWSGSASPRPSPSGATPGATARSSSCAVVGLDAEFDVATDPFFGRSGRMLAASQRQQELKFEILVPIAGPEPTAVASFNYHQDHFARDLRDRARRRRRRPHLVPGLRPRAHHARAPAHPRPRSRRRGPPTCAQSCES